MTTEQKSKCTYVTSELLKQRGCLLVVRLYEVQGSILDSLAFWNRSDKVYQEFSSEPSFIYQCDENSYKSSSDSTTFEIKSDANGRL